MKTVEDLKVEKITYKNETDENGNPVKVPVTKMVPRTPIVVEKGIRFGYYIIDVVFIYMLAFIIGFASVVAGADATTLADPIMSRVFGLLIFVGYYLILESTTGTTLGKMILGYTVINQYAEKPSFLNSLGRNFARAVPFEAFSCFSERGWHDTWSNTYVVKKSEKEELRKLLGKMNDNLDVID